VWRSRGDGFVRWEAGFDAGSRPGTSTLKAFFGGSLVCNFLAFKVLGPGLNVNEFELGAQVVSARAAMNEYVVYKQLQLLG